MRLFSCQRFIYFITVVQQLEILAASSLSSNHLRGQKNRQQESNNNNNNNNNSTRELTPIVPYSYGWWQMGDDIDMPNYMYRLGYDITMCGNNENIIATSGSDGKAYVYTYQGDDTETGSWNQQGNAITGGTSFFQGAWPRLLTGGSRVSCAASEGDSSAYLAVSTADTVSIYDVSSGRRLLRTIVTEGSGSWSTVSLSKITTVYDVAVGTPEEDNNRGCVRVYVIGREWNQKGNTICGDNPGDMFGYSVSLRTSFVSSLPPFSLAVGAPTANNNNGYTKTFTWGSDWELRGTVMNGRTNHLNGYSVSLSGDGDTMAVASPGWNGERGMVKLYGWDEGLSDWTQIGSTLEGTNWIGRFGSSVKVSYDGKNVAVGEAFEGSPDRGDTHVYQWDIPKTDWDEQHLYQDHLRGEVYERSGTSVALSKDGLRVAIGAPGFSKRIWIPYGSCKRVAGRVSQTIADNGIIIFINHHRPIVDS